MLTALLWAAISSLSLLWWFSSIFKEEKTLSQTIFDVPAACAMLIACIGYDCSGNRYVINKVQLRAYPSAVSAADIVNEVLRPYPPTKRVYRKFHMAGKRTPRL